MREDRRRTKTAESNNCEMGIYSRNMQQLLFLAFDLRNLYVWNNATQLLEY
jgi:hypothetical protein